MAAYQITKIKSGNEYFCDIDCDPKNGRRYAAFRLEILDYPAGYLCKGCAKSFKNLWASASSFK